MSTAARVGCVGLTSVLFFTVSGGPYGLEPIVASVNPGWAMVLVAIVPIVWGAPIALMVAELSTMLPDEGGYYVWVKHALGPFWAVQEGWWSICSIAFDTALYPVLFVDYLSYFMPALALDADGHATLAVYAIRWLVAIAVIATAFLVNVRGARSVGDSAAISLIWLLVPIALFVVAVLSRSGAAATAWARIAGGLRGSGNPQLLAVGFATVLWNYSGWDNVGTFAEEVEHPQRNYPLALAISSQLIVVVYLLPLVAGIAVTADPAAWEESAGWPTIARLAGGPLLGGLIAGAALISAWSLFSSQLLSVSRIPYVMARDGWLPSRLARLSPRMIPVDALVAACVISAVLAAFTFENLIVLDVLLYAASLVLEFLALLALRRKSPDAVRPFRIPGGWPVLVAIVAAPTLCGVAILVAMVEAAASSPGRLVVAAIAIFSGVGLYLARAASAARDRSVD